MYIIELFHGGPEQDAVQPAHNELVTEANQAQLVVLYPGRFQPFHLGHADVFRSLQSKFGRNNVFIATSNVTDAKKSPFNFADKTTIMHAAGVPADRVLETTSPYKLPAQFDPASTIFVVAVGAPDADRLRPDSTKKDGTPGYYKTFKSLAECETADKHGYVVIADERHFAINLNGQEVDVSHGTPSRAAWNMVRNDPAGRAEYMTQMFGRADPELGRILDKIPATTQTTESKQMATQTKPTDPEDFDALVTSVGQKAKQGPMKTVWVPAKHGTGGHYRVVPVNSSPVKEDDAPLTRADYMSRRKALQQIQMDPALTRDPSLRKELIKKIARLTMQARAAGVLPESVYSVHMQENKLFEARAIVSTIKHLKESIVQEGEFNDSLKSRASALVGKIMGVAPEKPKYQIGQRVSYETNPRQPDWKDGGKGSGVITDYKNGHYMINGQPVNHFEIKSVAQEAVGQFNDDDWYEVDAKSNTVLRNIGGPSAYRAVASQPIKLPNGNTAVRGMQAKRLAKK